MIQSETEKFFEDTAIEAMKRLGIPPEDAGYYTSAQRRLIMYIAEGYHLWKVTAVQTRGRWFYTFMFGKNEKGRSVKVSKEELDGLKDRHIHLFTETGMAVLDEDCLTLLEADLEYEENRANGGVQTNSDDGATRIDRSPKQG